MSISEQLLKLANLIEEQSEDLIIEAEKTPKLVAPVINNIAYIINHLESVAVNFEKAEKLVTSNSLDDLASLATSLDESNDPELKKQASVLDEILLTIGAPKGAIAESIAKNENEINKLREKYRLERVQELYSDRSQRQKEIQEKESETRKAVKDQIKKYRPLEAPLSTRYCPDHPGAGITRIGDHIFQCSLDKKIYNYETGFKTEKGNEIPGGGVEYQTPDWGHREIGHSVFNTRETAMSRFASVKTAEVDYHDNNWLEENYSEAYEALPEPYKNDSVLEFFMDNDNDLIAKHDLGGFYIWKDEIWQAANLEKDNEEGVVGLEEDSNDTYIPFELTDEEHEGLSYIADRYDSAKTLYEGWDSDLNVIRLSDVYEAYEATEEDGGDKGVVPLAGGTLLKKINTLFEHLV